MNITDDNNYIYMIIPKEYYCIYTKLLVKLSDYGVDLIKDCTATCKGVNKQILNCWNMFQSACAAYQLGGDENNKRAKLLINYIKTQLKLSCDMSDDKNIELTPSEFTVKFDTTYVQSFMGLKNINIDDVIIPDNFEVGESKKLNDVTIYALKINFSKNTSNSDRVLKYIVDTKSGHYAVCIINQQGKEDDVYTIYNGTRANGVHQDDPLENPFTENEILNSNSVDYFDIPIKIDYDKTIQTRTKWWAIPAELKVISWKDTNDVEVLEYMDEPINIIIKNKKYIIYYVYEQIKNSTEVHLAIVKR